MKILYSRAHTQKTDIKSLNFLVYDIHISGGWKSKMSNTGHKSCPINFKPEAMWKARSRPNSMIIILKTRQWERKRER
jgi:hypothetical protein